MWNARFLKPIGQTKQVASIVNSSSIFIHQLLVCLQLTLEVLSKAHYPGWWIKESVTHPVPPRRH